MAGDTASPCARCFAVLAPAHKHLRPVVRDDVYQEFTFVSHAVHPCPLPPDAGSDILASRSECSLAGQDTLSERFPRFVAYPQLLVGYG